MGTENVLIGYLLVSGAAVYILTLGQTKFHRDGIVGKLNVWLTHFPGVVIAKVAGLAYGDQKKGDALAQRVSHWLFDTRHPLMFYAYILLTGSAVVLYYAYVYPALFDWCIKGYGSVWHTVAAPVVTIFTLALFFAACWSDPGEVTAENVQWWVEQYPYDNALYFPGNACSTCEFVKPARSKHCRLCNRCIGRFDHHCGWLNNDVGGGNYLLFTTFLFAHVVLCSYGVWTCWMLIQHHLMKVRVWDAHFVSAEGERFAPTFWTVARYAFQQNTAAVAEFVFMGCVAVMMALFLAHHLYLAARNKTTNETFKLQDLADAHEYHEDHVALHAAYVKEHPDEDVPPPPASPPDVPATWLYDRGVLGNLCDAFRLYEPKSSGDGDARRAARAEKKELRKKAKRR
eukprot:TRINITY_DN1940_c0_g1_i1.p3 TRINITY_DN1940_c0_g1~~TRINITY_DN1940_c0_g1_i1.p3  ORF type:complete len:400 (+),score=121.62 TRINITY_DN1940_c0_g1_i1:1643-2842(+)